mgnify:CR=1 FL=1
MLAWPISNSMRARERETIMLAANLSEYHAQLHEGIAGRETGVEATYERMRQQPANRRLTDEDVRLVRASGKLLAPQLTQMVNDWYDWLRQQEAFQTYFANNPRTLERVRGLQHRHWEQMFECNLNAEYFAGRRRIGAVHAHIDLPNDIYYAGMCIAIRLLLERVMRLDAKKDECEGMLHALNKVCMLDTYLTCDEISRIQRDKLEVSSKALMEMSTPVTPIWEGILLLPLVGILDSVRTPLGPEFADRSPAEVLECGSLRELEFSFDLGTDGGPAGLSGIEIAAKIIELALRIECRDEDEERDGERQRCHARCAPDGTISRPSGFDAPEAILATSLLLPPPTLIVSRVVSRTVRFNSRATRSASPCNRSVPARSTYASSTETCSTTGLHASSSSITSCDASA